MNPTTAKALSLAIAVAVWALISHLANLVIQLWPVLVGLACFLAAGGGITGLTKSMAGSASGVIWAFLYVSVSGALGRNEIVDALVLGGAALGMVLQSGIPFLTHTPSVIAGAAVSMGVMGIRAVSFQGGLRVMIPLLIGAGLGYGAEYLAAIMKPRNS